MRPELAYSVLIAVKSRSVLPPAAGVLFALVGIFHDPYNPVGPTWALASVLCVGLSAWSVLATLHAEPPPQADMFTAAIGGTRGRVRVAALTLAVQALGLAIVFTVAPLVLDLVVSRPVFDRPVEVTDVTAAFFSTLTGAAVGGALGSVCGPPRVAGRAVGAAVVTGSLIALVAGASVLGDVGGPMAVASALNDIPAGRITTALLVSWTSSLVLAGSMLAAMNPLTRLSG